MLAMPLFTGDIATGKLRVKALPFESLEGGYEVIGRLKSAEERKWRFPTTRRTICSTRDLVTVK
jgi:hypothetical protein